MTVVLTKKARQVARLKYLQRRALEKLHSEVDVTNMNVELVINA